ncbi:hypothetical protein PIROE2DRAFT_9452 [Piromyces sp. E2]|nr:hypothetical protein PIROE2DRAFT_9452 [Piromyces sp. E2]|eukprot:OUM63921.1 hypothetical protein PIROE2DRAFT_9452 [Piromyces sp. E2]
MCEGYVHSSTMVSGKAIFSRFWNIDLGDNNRFSVSIVGGYNIIINNSSSESKKRAAGKIIDFLLSKEMQLKYFLKLNKCSGLKDIYYDEELCSVKDCELFKNMQYVSRPISYADNYDEYSEKYRDYFTKFLTGKLTAEETLKNIDDIARIYYVEFDSKMGKTIIILTIIIIVMVICSYYFILNERYQFYLSMFDKKFWFLALVGFCLISTYGLFNLGIIYVPQANKFSKFILKNKYLSMLFFFSFDLMIAVIFFAISPYKITEHIVNDGENYERCNFKSNISKIGLICLILSFLLFIEWNLEDIQSDIGIIATIIYNIIIKTLLAFFLTLINYTLMIWYKLYLVMTLRNKEEEVNLHEISMESSSVYTDRLSDRNSIVKKIINMHYSTSSHSGLNREKTMPKQNSRIFTSQFTNTNISDIVKTVDNSSNDNNNNNINQ